MQLSYAARAVMYTVVFLCVVVLSVPASVADDYVRQAVTPSWVEQQLYNVTSLDGLPTSGPAYLLISNQRYHEVEDEHYYSRYVSKINDISAAETASQLSVSFDPSYERLKIHFVNVIRNGQVQTRYNPERLKIFQNEADAERLIYNGSVSASFILQDIRPGDIIDYAYTISGKNPVFFNHISDRIRLEYSVRVGKRYASLNLPNDRKYQVIGHGGAPEPVDTVDGGRRSLVWNLNGLEADKEDDGEPIWFERFAFYEVTDQESWQSLGQHYAPFYSVPAEISDALSHKIQQIDLANGSVEQKIRAALKYVQSNIRYLGIESGKGGYAPRDPSIVLDQRFGDCKDKTILLVTILERMGIKAQPVLVDSDLNAAFQRRLPSAYAFDHVITRVVTDKETYWLDPTNNDQIGDLANMQQADFGAGLVVDGAGSKIEAMTPPIQRLAADVIETFDIVKEPGNIFLSVKSTFWGDRADSLAKWKNDDGMKYIEQEYLKFYQANYPTIKALAPLSFEANKTEGTVIVEERYEIPGAWKADEENNRQYFNAWPGEITSALPDANLVPRTAPLDLSAPTYVKHELRFLVDDTWSLSDEMIEIDNRLFSFSKHSTFKDNVYSQKYVYKGRKDVVELSELVEFNSDAEKADDEASVQLQQSTATGASANGLTKSQYKIIGYVVVFGFAAGLIGLSIFAFVKAVSADVNRRAEAVYFPITQAKYWVMSLGTFGMYPFFWTFKNWQWIRDVEQEKLSPFWRSLFSIFTNFSLFPRLATAFGDKMRMSGGIAASFATYYLVVAVVDAVISSRSEDFGKADLFGLLLLPALAPFVSGIIKLNQISPHIIAANSRYSWHSAVALSIGAMVWLLIAADLMKVA